MDKETIRQYGDELYDAWLDRRVLSPLLERAPRISLADAYAMQLRLVKPSGAGRVKQSSARRLGLPASQSRTFWVFMSPILASSRPACCALEDQGIDLDQLIQPKAEAELAFVLNKDLIGRESQHRCHPCHGLRESLF